MIAENKLCDQQKFFIS